MRLWLYDTIRDDDLFEQFCEVLGEAIDVDGYKLQLLAFYDVETVFKE